MSDEGTYRADRGRLPARDADGKSLSVGMPQYLRDQLARLGPRYASFAVAPKIDPAERERREAYGRAFDAALRALDRVNCEAIAAWRVAPENSPARVEAQRRVQAVADERDRLYEARNAGAPLNPRTWTRLGDTSGQTVRQAAKSSAPLFDQPTRSSRDDDADILDSFGGR